MKLVKTIAAISVLTFSTLSLASSDHEHEAGLALEGEGDHQHCVGLLGHAGTPGPFLQDSEEMALAIETAACNLCLGFVDANEECLDEHKRSEILETEVSATNAAPGRRAGAKVVFDLVGDSAKVEYICHFHGGAESGEIDCH